VSVTAERWADVRAQDTGVKLTLGPNTVGRYLLDPKRIAFMLSRYKFAAKMLRDCQSIIDIGCGDGFGTLTFLEDTKAERVLGVDFDPQLIEYAKLVLWPAVRKARNDSVTLGFREYDMLRGDPNDHDVRQFSGLCCTDVIEHIEPSRADAFIAKMYWTLRQDGVAVVGTPSKYAAQFASPQSQIGHINLYEPDRLREELGKHFKHVFLFSMNDEIVHTGFDKLAHYLMAVAIK